MMRGKPVSGWAGLVSQKLSLEFSVKSRLIRLGSSPGPKMPGAAESLSVPQAQAGREPSRTGRLAAWNKTLPSAVSHLAASALVTSGTARMSAYRA